MANRIAFVSGAGQNIGRAIVLRLAEQKIDVIVNGRSNRAACDQVAETARAFGVRTHVIMGDVGRRDVNDRMAREALEWSGGIDVLINNAAIRPHKPFLETTDENWTEVMNVNLNAAIWLSRAFLPGMIARKWGRIVNFTGIRSMEGTVEHGPVSVAKHGALGLAKTLAREFGPSGITANTISPGVIAFDDEAKNKIPRLRDAPARIPLRRIGTPADVAAMVGFLCSDEGGYVSGQMISINGAMAT